MLTSCRHRRLAIATFSVWLLAAALYAPLRTAAAADAPRRPNIVLIMADDFGYECVGANGGTSYRTPVLDRLAAGGLRFEHCYSQPLCTPSRVQLMTGRYNQRNYVRFAYLDPRVTTFAQLLKQAGYATCIGGKWQLEGGFDGPRHFGFDEHCLWQLNRRPERYRNPGLEIDGKRVDYTKGEYGPDLVADHLCDFIERHKDGPFLVYYPMILTHSPFVPTPDSTDWGRDTQGKSRRQDRQRHFADMVAYADTMVGRIVTKLDQLGLREDTLVLFTGDNGTGREITSRMGDRIIHGGKGRMTDAGTRVPLIASWPGTISPGKVSQTLVDFSDFLPTLVELAGAQVPPDLPLDGRSFAPLLRGGTYEPRQWVYCWYARDGGPTGAEFARNQKYKLYRDGRFYHVAADPLEQQALPAEKLTADAVAARAMLRGVLDRFENTRQITAAPEKPAGRNKKRRRPADGR